MALTVKTPAAYSVVTNPVIELRVPVYMAVIPDTLDVFVIKVRNLICINSTLK